MKVRTMAAALVLLATAGCGGDGGGGDRPADKPVLGSPVPTPTSTRTPTPVGPKPDQSAPLLDKIRYGLQEQTVRMAFASAPTSARCDRAAVSGTAGERVSCVVTYAGLSVPWSVTIKSGGVLVQYDAVPATGVITRRGVLTAFYATHADQPEVSDLRCGDLPDRQLVPLDQKTQFRCQYSTTRYGAGRVTLAVVSSRVGPDFQLP